MHISDRVAPVCLPLTPGCLRLQLCLWLCALPLMFMYSRIRPLALGKHLPSVWNAFAGALANNTGLSIALDIPV